MKNRINADISIKPGLRSAGVPFDDDCRLGLQMEVDLRNEIDIETKAGENSASVPRTNASAPWRAEHGSMLEPIALTGGVA